MQVIRLLKIFGKTIYSITAGAKNLICQPRLEKAAMAIGGLRLQGRIRTNKPMDRMCLVVRQFRGAGQIKSYDLTLIPDRRNPVPKAALRLLGFRFYQFDIVLESDWAQEEPGIFSIELQTCGSGRAFHFRGDTSSFGAFSGNVPYSFCVFMEPSVQVVRIEMHAVNSDAIKRIKSRAETPQARPTCIVGEYPNTARDNGFYLFRCLEETPCDIDAFYVLQKTNSDGIQAGAGQIVEWGSEEHLLRCVDASVCAFTHHRNYVYPAILKWIVPEKYEETRTLFLQHGVMAMKSKPVVEHYHKERVNYDAVVVSSEREKDIFSKNFGYRDSAIHVSGLPRLDRLYAQARSTDPVDKQILVAPTWRQGLEKMTRSQVENHLYTQQWCALMHEMRKVGFSPILIGHQIMHQHASVLGKHAVEIRPNLMFQRSLLESSALITDHSSTAWDALYVERPAFLFQFDQTETEFLEHAFISKCDLPGPVDHHPIDLVQRLIVEANDGWPFNAYAQRDKAFRKIDGNNTKRNIALIHSLARSDVTNNDPVE